MKIIKFYNEYHLGDNVLHIHFLRNLVTKYNVIAEYYIHKEYIDEINLLVSNFSNIHIYPLTAIKNDMINAWIGEIYFQTNNKFYYNEFYMKWFDYLSSKIGFPNIVDSMILDWDEFNVEDSGYDILFINSISRSNEYNYIESEDFYVAKKLNERGNLITTKKVPNIQCTIDSNMSLLDIAKISVGVKQIIAVNTSPIHMCMNKNTLRKVEDVIVIARSHGMNFNEKFRYAKDIFELKNILGI